MKNFHIWPTVIVAVFAVAVTAIIITLYLSLKDPMEYDSYFGGDFDYVKKNYLRLDKNSKAFDLCCRLAVPEALRNGTNILKIKLTEQDKPLENAVVNAWLTRPATNRFDIKLHRLKFQDDFYVSDAFELETKGIWKLELRIKVKDLEIHRSFDYDFMPEKKS